MARLLQQPRGRCLPDRDKPPAFCTLSRQLGHGIRPLSLHSMSKSRLSPQAPPAWTCYWGRRIHQIRSGSTQGRQRAAFGKGTANSMSPSKLCIASMDGGHFSGSVAASLNKCTAPSPFEWSGVRHGAWLNQREEKARLEPGGQFWLQKRGNRLSALMMMTAYDRCFLSISDFVSPALSPP